MQRIRARNIGFRPHIKVMTPARRPPFSHPLHTPSLDQSLHGQVGQDLALDPCILAGWPDAAQDVGQRVFEDALGLVLFSGCG